MAKKATFIKYLFLGFIVLTGSIVSTAQAAPLFVPGAVPPYYPNIQAAINASINGDIITVIGPATYSGTGFFNVDFNGKDVTVQAGNAAGIPVPWSVIIDCNNQGRAFIFQGGETNLARLDGFIIINGYAQDTSWPQDPAVDASGYGGAIYIKDSSPIIIDCLITDCTADAGGGAIFCDENSGPQESQILWCDIGANSRSYNFAGWGFYQYIDINDVNDVNNLDVNDLHQLGGGIYCRNSSPRIDNCIIIWNTAAGSGGGIACEGSNANISNCTIEDNDAFVEDDRIDQHGGGIYIKDCKDRGPRIQRSFTQLNAARWSGGGIAVQDSNAFINLCSIYDNHCWASAGGIYSQGNPHSDPNTDPNRPNIRIQNSAIVFNWGYWSGGVSSNYGSSTTFSNATITQNVASWSWLVGGLEAYGGWADGNGVIIWDNIGEEQRITAGLSTSAMGMEFGGSEMEVFGVNPSMNFSYSNIQMLDNEGYYDPTAVWPGEGNINKDPMFVNPNRRPYDLHLLSTSPCINAGDPFADYSQEPAPNGARINIGAYGGTDEATSSDILRPVPSDADADLEVNLVDFAILANNWGLEGTSIQNKKADADNNNIVDTRDLAILNKFWLWIQ